MTTQEKVGGLSPEARELFAEMERLVEGGEDVAIKDFGGRIDALAARGDALAARGDYSLMARILEKEAESAALVEIADAARGLAGMILWAAGVAGRDPENMTFVEAAEILEATAWTRRGWGMLARVDR